MKAVILAGGYGTRISEESHLRPKPMIEIGGYPILWHIMKHFAYYGVCDFVICCGYKQEMIKRYFFDYFLHHSDVTFDLQKNDMQVHHNHSEPWRVTLVDTGLDSQTGSRIKQIRPYMEESPFLMTYGDGVSNVPLDRLLRFHHEKGTIATLTAVQPEGRFGVLHMDQDKIMSFKEKNRNDAGWINGGFMVFEPAIFDYIPEGTDVILEEAPLERLALDGQLSAYQHYGFWQCMDTQRDMKKLETLWQSGHAPWLIWE